MPHNVTYPTTPPRPSPPRPASYDADDDNSPFQSAVLRVGHVVGNRVTLYEDPTTVTFMEGLKVEAVTIAGDDIFIATDDEKYGGVMRLVTKNASYCGIGYI